MSPGLMKHLEQVHAAALSLETMYVVPIPPIPRHAPPRVYHVHPPPPHLPPALRAAPTWSFPCGLGAVAATSLALERNAIGRRLTSPFLAFLLGSLLRRLHVLPASHPIYEALTGCLLPAALPLMVISAQTRPLGQGELLPTLLAFLVCVFASCAGAICAFALSHGLTPAPVACHICGCLDGHLHRRLDGGLRVTSPPLWCW